MLSKNEIVRAVRSERRRTLGLVRPLEPERYDTPALPGWRVREVVAHLITRDKSGVTGSILPHVFSASNLEAWNDRVVRRWADRPVQELILGLDRWGRRFARLASAIPSPVYRLKVPTLWGKGPAAMLIWSCAFDDFVHRQDIRRALGMQDEVVDLEPVVEFVLVAIGTGTPQKLERRTGRLAISAEGCSVAAWGYDLTTGAAGPDLAAGADARVSLPAISLIMASCDRESFERLRSNGTLTVEGDEDLAGSFLTNVRVV